MVYLQERTDRYALFIFGKKGEALPYHAFILHVLVNNRSEWTDLFFPIVRVLKISLKMILIAILSGFWLYHKVIS